MENEKRAFYEQEADNQNYFLLEKFISSKIDFHFHKSYEFVYCVKGETQVYINGKKHVLTEGEMYCVSSYDVHNNSFVCENEILSLVFSEDFFDDFKIDFSNKFFPNLLKNKQENKKIYQYLLDFYNKNYPFNNLFYMQKQAFINHFLFMLYNVYPIQEKVQDEKIEILVEILKYINENYHKDIDLSFLAKKFSYSPQYFSTLFNKSLGINLKNYINNIRISKVKEKISQGEANISKIVMDCGFKSLATYYRVKEKNKY